MLKGIEKGVQFFDCPCPFSTAAADWEISLVGSFLQISLTDFPQTDFAAEADAF